MGAGLRHPFHRNAPAAFTGGESRTERRSSSPWDSPDPPRRLLLIRFHALGDVALVLPAAAHLAGRWPGTGLDLLTTYPADSLARATGLFRAVVVFPGASGRLMRLIGAIRTGLLLRKRKYDLVIDLQRNRISRIIRWLSHAHAWSEFDRFSPLPASSRVLSTLSLAGIKDSAHAIPLPCSAGPDLRGRRILEEAGWDGSTRLVVFNPAGIWATRNWPLPHYVELYRLWSMREPVRILVLGTAGMLEKGRYFAREGGMDVINLAGKTTAGEAFAVLRHADVIVSEDSGLMHIAWAAGVPVVALFGSTRSDWSAPRGERAVCLDSRDLECGSCMEPACRFGDVRCLSRYTPQGVLDSTLALLARIQLQSGELHL